MIYSVAITKICKLLNDPKKVTYEDIAKDMFESAICELALSAIPEDILDLAKTVHKQTIGGVIDFGAQNPLKFVNIYQTPISTQKKLVKLTQAQFARLNTEDGYTPLSDEIYWCVYFNKIQFYPTSTETTVKLMYIGKPKDYAGLATDPDLTIDFSLNFIYKCIELAALKIRRIIKGESS